MTDMFLRSKKPAAQLGEIQAAIRAAERELAEHDKRSRRRWRRCRR